MFVLKFLERIAFEEPGAGGGGGGNADPGGGGGGNAGDFVPASMDTIRQSSLSGLDESYHEEWNTLSSKITTPSDLAKNYIESQRHARSAITVPGVDAKPEQWDDVYTKLGRPEKADGYQFRDTFGEGENTYAVTDEDKSFRQAFAPVAHRLGFSQAQLAGLEAWQYENNNITADARFAKADDITARNEKVLKQQHGPDFERNKQNYLMSTRHYSGSDWEAMTSVRLEDGSFLLDAPFMFNMMSKIGAERSEDFREPNAMNEAARGSAKDEYDRIRTEAINKGLLPSSPNWPTDELQKLSNRVHGSTSAIGGRSVSN